MDRRQAFVEEVVHTLIESGVKAVHAEDFEACVRSLDDAVAVYESNPSYAQAPKSHFAGLLLFIHAARTVSEELGRSVDDLRALNGRAQALRQSIH
jgi:hypothetical protein